MALVVSAETITNLTFMENNKGNLFVYSYREKIQQDATVYQNVITPYFK